MFGIKLKKNTKLLSNPVVGELQYITDTDEFGAISNGELVFRKNSQLVVRYGVSKDSEIPTGGENGDWGIDTSTINSEYKEYFKVGNWNVRPEGYTEEYLRTNFASKVNWSGFLTRDGSVKFDSTNYDSKILTPESLVVKKNADIAISNMSGVSVSGSDSMLPTYEPTLNGDVLDIKSLASGNLYFYPPTTEPTISGAIWNDNGVVKITFMNN